MPHETDPPCHDRRRARHDGREHEAATDAPHDPERLTCAKLTFVIAEQESGCQANPKCKPGPDCNDDGKACGAMQTHEPQKIISTATCEKVRADRRLGLKVGLTHLRALGQKCRTIGLALSAYATRGECLKLDWQRSLTRCKLAGLDCSSPWTPGA